MKEQLIYTFEFNLNALLRFTFEICVSGYNKTHNKFDVIYSGSKGYLSHLEVYCEGVQKEGINRLDIFSLVRSRKKNIVKIFHSEKNGVRIEVETN